jgi:hypothetical protein
MSNAFVESPARGFKQSLGRQRVTRVPGQFIFQFLQCIVYAHNTDGTPWGAFPNQDSAAKWPNAMDAGPFVATPIPHSGATQEFWNAFIHPFPQSNDPFLARSTTPVDNPIIYSPARKHLNYWQTGSNLSGPIIWRKLIAYRYNVTYLPFTSPIGTSFPGGSFEEQAYRFKIFPPVSGTVTWHSLPFDGSGVLYSDLGTRVPPPFPITIPLWKRQEYLDVGHPVREFAPDPPTAFVRDFTSATPPFGTTGTLELALFWFERKPDELPPFPYLMDPSAAVV